MKKRLLTNNNDGTFSVPLTRGLTAIVDAEDAERVGQYNWSAWVSRKGDSSCAVTKMGDRVVKLHRWLLGIDDPSAHVDHRNQNPLDNRRANLRVATHAENQRNKSVRRDSLTGVKGVSLHACGKWQARIASGRSGRYLGLFDTLEAAADAYAKAAAELHGQFACVDNAEPVTKPRAPRKSRTGVKGVSKTRYGRFEAHAFYGGKLHYLGTYDIIEAAAEAVRAKERELDAAI